MSNREFDIFLFNYSDMRLGGIQTVLYRYIRFCVTHDIPVIWAHNGPFEVAEGFRDFVNPNAIDMIPTASLSEVVSSKRSESEPRVLCLSFYLKPYMQFRDAIASLHGCVVKHFLVIPHFAGFRLFPEERMGHHRAKAAKQTFAEVYQRFVDNNSILFCNAKQLESLEEHYDLKISDKPYRMLPLLKEPGCLDASTLHDRWMSKTIVTTTRFELPHKAYLLGLIDAFRALKMDGSDATLKIIGYGPDEDQVAKKVESLPPEIAKDVYLMGQMSREETLKIYARSYAFVGVAGALNDAASVGLIALPARHYCAACEVYGLYSQPNMVSIDDGPGSDALPILKRLLALSEDEYNNESKLTVDAYNERSSACDSISIGQMPDPVAVSFDEGCERFLKKEFRNEILHIRALSIKRFVSRPSMLVKRLHEISNGLGARKRRKN